MNGYFQLETKSDGVYVRIYPPVEHGEFVNIKELLAYLDLFQLNQYDMQELNAATKNAEKQSMIYVAPPMELHVDEMMNVSVSLDKMQVFCKFYPPSNGGANLTAEKIVDNLKSKKIAYGIDAMAIKGYLKNREYCREYIFAMGKSPEHGSDARIEYFFNTNLNLKPKKNEDGSVDYRDLNTISRVSAGDMLARLIPEDPGKPGTDVYGNDIKPRTVHKKNLEYGNNIRINEERTEIYSEVTGHVSMVKGKVFVSDVYDVPADVDNSTGNIDYTGNVHIAGNVRGGFYVRAKGDIVVEGVVEDAELEADGQIIVKRGIHGMGRGKISAEGNVICQFIESATVTSGGFVETDCILHSKVSAYSEIHVIGKKGFITGGIIRAGSTIEAQIIGSEMGSDTRIEVGTDPKKKERFQELKNILEGEVEELNKVKVILANYTRKLQAGEELPPDRMNYVQRLAYEYKEKKDKLEPLREEQTKLRRELMLANGARIQVRKTIYTGVTIAISDMEMRIKDEQNFCQYVKKNGEIVRMTL